MSPEPELTAVLDRLFPAGPEQAGAVELGIAGVLLSGAAPAAEREALVAALAELAGAGTTAGAGAMAGAVLDRRLAQRPAAAAVIARLAAQEYYGRPHLAAAARSPWQAMGYRDEPPGGWPEPTGREVEPAGPEALSGVYDAVVIGSGPGGGTAAMVLAEAGWSVLLVERGSVLSGRTDPVGNDRSSADRLPATGEAVRGEPRLLETAGGEQLVHPQQSTRWHRNPTVLGGGSTVYGAQAWRFLPEDFRMADEYGVPPGSSVANWPIGYHDLEPYYGRAERLVGVAGSGPSHPMPAPLPGAGTAALVAGARALGLPTGPVPLAVNTTAYQGRPACARCGACVGFACPGDMKNGSQNTVVPRALATGRCRLLLRTRALRVTTDGAGRADGVRLLMRHRGRLVRGVARARVVVVAAGAIESARLLLASAHDGEPNGMGNATDQVGRHLQGHAYGGAAGVFDEEVQDARGPGPTIATGVFRRGNPGVIGGGVLADDFVPTPLTTWHWLRSAGLIPARGEDASRGLREAYRRTLLVVGCGSEVPDPASRVTLDPHRADGDGQPLVRLGGELRPESRELAGFLADRAQEWLTAAGARRSARALMYPAEGPSAFQHQAGTCRMGDDPVASVTDPHGRLWTQPGVVVADASTHVTNGSVNPVLTVFANALRIAEHVAVSS